MTGPLRPPGEVMADMLAAVDHVLLAGAPGGTDVAGPEASVRGRVAQAYATCALVHAVRELTAEVRALRQAP